MGFYGTNAARLTRHYQPERYLLAEIHTNEYNVGWTSKRFEWEEIKEALAWIEKEMMQLSM